MTYQHLLLRWARRILVFFIGTLALQALAQDAAFRSQNRDNVGKRIALVIGNDNYQNVSKLQKAGNDATAMALELRAAGFDVLLHKDLNYRAMVKAMETLSNSITGGDQVVVFFAGHGVQLKSGNYLLPIDIDASSEGEVEKTAYALTDLTDKLSEAKGSFALVLVDACRDNPIKSKGRSVGNTRGLSPIDPPKGQMVVFSASKGQQALDRLDETDNDPNGVFTREFIKRMKQPGVRVEDMVREVQDSVEALARTVSHAQRPSVYSEARGNFYFYGKTTVVQAAPTVSGDPETQTWSTAERVNSIAAYQAYLDAYPNGRYGVAAKIAMGALRSAPPPAAQAVRPPAPAASNDPESQFWNEVKANGTREYFEAYLKQYPRGKYVALARVDLKRLEDQEKTNQTKTQIDLQLSLERERQEALRVEQSAWDDARAANTAAAAGAYLVRFPQGRFADLAIAAQQRLQREEAARAEQVAAQLKQQQAEAAQREQQAAWSRAEASDEAVIVQQFLDRYPNSSHAEQAKAKLTQLAEKLKQQQQASAAAALEEKEKARKAAATAAAPSTQTPNVVAAAKPGQPVPQPTDFTSGTTRFSGQFVRDADGANFSGTGKVIWANGDVFEGTLVRGIRQGKGLFIWANKQRFDGDWVDDLPHGSGKLLFANGNLYEGPVVKGIPNGNGRMQYPSGDVYTGSIAAGVPKGLGTYIWKNGQTFTGEWHGERPNGLGTLKFANGNVYEGPVVEGVPHGQGKLSFASGDVYNGMLVDGEPDGQGRFTWVSGDQYSGMWKAGKKHGQGVFTWKTGERWEGVYENDVQK